jgi:hypothetical protein
LIFGPGALKFLGIVDPVEDIMAQSVGAPPGRNPPPAARIALVGMHMGLAAALLFLSTDWVSADCGEQIDPMLIHGADGFQLRGYFQAGNNVVSETKLFWDLAATTAPGRFTARFRP